MTLSELIDRNLGSETQRYALNKKKKKDDIRFQNLILALHSYFFMDLWLMNILKIDVHCKAGWLAETRCWKNLVFFLR